MGRLPRHGQVPFTRFTLKVKLGRPIKLSDTAIKVGGQDLRFIFDKYGDNSLIFELTNLYGGLSSRGYSKTIKGDFVVFILKKKDRLRWKKLHGEQMSVLRMSSPPVEDSNLFGDKEQFRTGGFSGESVFLGLDWAKSACHWKWLGEGRPKDTD